MTTNEIAKKWLEKLQKTTEYFEDRQYFEKTLKIIIEAHPEYSGEDQLAGAFLIYKLDNPEKDVKCPLCGSGLVFIEKGTSAIVKCPTEGCCKPLHFRGI